MSFLFNLFTGAASTAVTSKLMRSTAPTAPRKIVRDGLDTLYHNEQLDTTQKVFGIPGASLYHADLNADARQAGIKGETKVAEALTNIVGDLTEARLFHSVKLPGRRGDIDHLIIIGDTAILVDTKNWKHDAAYQLDRGSEHGTDYVLRDGEPFQGGEIHLARQKDDWAHFLPNYNVQAILVIANEEAFATITSSTGYDFVNLLGLKNSILRAIQQTVLIPLSYNELVRFATLTQNPDFDPSDESNYVWVNDYSEPTYSQPARPQKTGTPRYTLGLMWWSILNYVLAPLVFPVAAVSTIPLIILAHKTLAKSILNNEGGQGILRAVLIFSYLFLFAWLFCIFLLIFFHFKQML